MSILFAVLAILLGLAACLVGLALYWSRTPHGRIKPIFALVFGLSRRFRPEAAARAIGAEHMDTPEQCARVRATFAQNTASLSKPVEFDGTVEDRRLAGSPGGELPVRIYTPASATGRDDLPLLVYFHGGGFVVGDPDYTDAPCRILAARTPAIVVSVDYRLAPEHPLPAVPDDCEFAVNWCFENAGALGARSGPVVVSGDSAGGNLAAVVSQRDRASGRGRIALQVLIYPCTDLSRTDRDSHVAFGTGFGLSTADIDDCVRHYAPAGTDRQLPALSPLYAKDLSGLPPAFVITAGFDVLRDEGRAYAEALERAGVEVAYTHEAELPHGFITMTRLCREAEATLEVIAARMRRLAG